MIISSIWTDRKQRYRFAICISCFLSGCFSLVIHEALKLENLVLTAVLSFFQGGTMLMILPIGFELMIEVTYPFGESYA